MWAQGGGGNIVDTRMKISSMETDVEKSNLVLVL
jgi:hypothetical protein